VGSATRDGAEARPPADLHLVPDAEPRIEGVRPGGPNKPYEVMGRLYVPLPGDPAVVERGLASWYGVKFHGRPTSSGEVYDMYAMTAAHRTMPLPSYARVRNPANGREVVVRVNDRGPFHPDRVIDLSYTAALKLGLLAGVAPVQVERITQEEIRSGNWRLPRPSGTPLVLPEPAAGVVDPLGELMRRAAERPEPVQRGPAGAERR
jgi:rare lipoprotein A